MMRVKIVRESVNFKRGQDPKATMGIGEFSKGYRTDKDPDYDTSLSKYYRFDFEDESWGWSKKTFDPDEISKTKVNPEKEKTLVKLPVVTFLYYWETNGIPGMFGDWAPDFPYTRTPFIANTLEEEGRSYLIEPEGYDYPRYITELI